MLNSEKKLTWLWRLAYILPILLFITITLGLLMKATHVVQATTTDVSMSETTGSEASETPEDDGEEFMRGQEILGEYRKQLDETHEG